MKSMLAVKPTKNPGETLAGLIGATVTQAVKPESLLVLGFYAEPAAMQKAGLKWRT
jgi:hypothetical protein